MKTDKQRIDWLEAGGDGRLQDCYWYIQNEGGTVRGAIDALAILKAARAKAEKKVSKLKRAAAP